MGRIETIMIVDDDEEDRDFLSQAIALIDPSVTCIEAINGEDGLKKLSDGRPLPGCIFLDLNMPRINGIEFLKSIKRIPGARELPIIIYTTSKLMKDKMETIQLGAVHFISKPATLDEITTSIRFIFERIGVRQ